VEVLCNAAAGDAGRRIHSQIPIPVSGGAKPPANGGENALLWVRPRSHPIPVFSPFAASRIRCAKLRLPLTPLRDILLKRCSKIVPGKHTPPFSGGFRPPFTIPVFDVVPDSDCQIPRADSI
jgi:hypothetical protein